MADLSITSGNGAQTTTQSPQSVGGSGTNTEAGSNVQPGTATALLTSPDGISLRPTPLATVNIGASASTITPSHAAITTAPPKHHVNSGLLGISAGLFVIAVIVVLFINRSAKNTTNYR
jgi:hypothetical protein